MFKRRGVPDETFEPTADAPGPSDGVGAAGDRGWGGKVQHHHTCLKFVLDISGSMYTFNRLGTCVGVAQ